MKITFLGTSGSVPTKESGLPAIAIHANELMLFDCGEGTQRQMMQFGVPFGSVNVIFITHLHLDHYLGIFGYMETLKLMGREKELHIFAPKRFSYPNKPRFVHVYTIKEGKIYENKEYEVYAFKSEHGVEAYGFRICRKKRRKFNKSKCNKLGIKGIMFKTLVENGKIKIGHNIIYIDDVSKEVYGPCVVYTGDTVYSKRVVNESKGADVLIHDATFSNDERSRALETFHSTASDAAMAAQEAGVKQLILFHISPRYRDRKILLREAKKKFNKTSIAHDGDVLSVL